MNTQTIKQIWLDFFKSKGHTVEPSASLIPLNDPSLLWINAGVAPLKGYFEGTEVPASRRLVNAQKCIRTNDIEQVGKTARHHTFFEMLGNFSIGDYFRDEIIPWAFELLTSKNYYGMDLNRLYFTVYPTDHESKALWESLGVDPSHIIATDYNFWEIGEGPSGPSTEIFYDRGDAYGPADPSMIEKDIENDRYVEIWNIVFSQFNAKKGIPREDYQELPSKNIDTGMGLERMACILQAVPTNFETDGFIPIIQATERLSGIPYDGQLAYKVIADHIRSVTFALADGAQLSNEGRGYVLRRLLRRAVKHGKALGIEGAFLHTLVASVISIMAESYPYLEAQKKRIERIIQKEETKFLETLNAGEKRLKEWLKTTKETLPGEAAFKLYDTYGFPVELTQEMAEEAGVSVDLEGFEAALNAQKERARSARKESANMRAQDERLLNFKTPSTFVGYDTLTAEATITLITDEGIVTDQTPFYAESGGQVSDRGILRTQDDEYEVLDVVKLPNGQHLHVIEGFTGEEGDAVELIVDERLRRLTEKHHSVTHLVYHNLRELVGTHITQQGSFVSEDHMRFDFSSDAPLSDELLLRIEDATNQDIQAAHPVTTIVTDLKTAKARGATAEFGEKYTGDVRMVDMEVTLDLCGGTHVKNTEAIQGYALISMESKGSGIYRIMGLVNDASSRQSLYLKGTLDALDTLEAKAQTLSHQLAEFDLTPDFPKRPHLTFSYRDVLALRTYRDALQEALKSAQKTLEARQAQSVTHDLDAYVQQAKGKRLVMATEGLDAKAFKTLVDACFEAVKGTVAAVNVTDKLMIVVKSKEADVHAGNLTKSMAQMAGGGGGGSPEFAQAGAKDVSQKEAIIQALKEQLY